MSDGFIAYQDEEHGLGFKVAQILSEKYARRELRHGKSSTVSDMKQTDPLPLKLSPRRDTASTLASLISHRAAFGLVPLEDDRGKYDKLTLEALIDFKDYYIEAEMRDDDDYVLAVPSVSIYELGESAFPSSHKSASHVGALPRNLEMQETLRRRVGVIYASADALERCQAALHGYEAQGIDIQRLADNEDPYRTILNKALEGLDQDRMIYTAIDDSDSTVRRLSGMRAAAHAKPLIGVLLPRDVATMGRQTMGNGLADPSSSEYVLLDDHLEGNTKMASRFLVLSRIGEKTRAAKPVIGVLGQQDIWMRKVNRAFQRFIKEGDKAEHDYARFLIKLDTRGKGVLDIDEITDELNRAKLAYTPIVLNKRPDRLPVILEVEVPNEPEARRKFKTILTKCHLPGRNWNTRLLGGFGTDVKMDVVMPTPSHRWSWKAFAAGAAILAALTAIGFSAYHYFA